MIETPSYDNLIEEVADSLIAHYQRWVAEYPSDDIYAYVIYATSLVSSISVSVLSEQGLNQVAADYKNEHGYKESIAQLKVDLRWSVADSPYCGDIQEIFETVNARLESMTPYVDSLEIDDPAFSTHLDRLYSILVAALVQFRHEVLHDEIRPMLYVDFGDMSDEERLWFIEQCNALEVVKEYCSSLESAG